MADHNIETALKEEAKTLERALEAMPEFRRLKVIQKALADLAAIGAGKNVIADTFKLTLPSKLASSINQAAGFALEEVGYPLSTQELLKATPRYGRTVGGQNPATNLSNSLSSDKKFQSVPWDGGRAWWFANRPVPQSQGGKKNQAAE